MDLGLKGRRALVMGASKGLGRAVADALAAEGVHIVISGRDQATLDKAAAELRGLGASSAIGVQADVAEAADMDRLVEAAQAAMGGVDILVLNHGGPPPGSAQDLTEAALTTWFRRIVLSPIQVANKVLPGMKAQKWGRILTVGSSGMQQPIAGLALSNVLRAGIVGWNKTLSAEVIKDGITCNIIAPGTISTDRIQELNGARAAKEGRSLEEISAERAAEIPAGRFGRPDEFGPMGAFLASEKASYITGMIIRADGGIVRHV
ncbi:SDR family oxidoreductase [Acetobacteraceae bacterium H6797]|nr:SDR family oxidoreductase [Acetobacteraceae bacterium H6797]